MTNIKRCLLVAVVSLCFSSVASALPVSKPADAASLEGSCFWLSVGYVEPDWLANYIPFGQFITEAMAFNVSVATVSDFGAPSVQWLETVLSAEASK